MDSPDRTRKDFYQELLKTAVIIKEFSPYKDKNKHFADDVIMQTGGPFLGRELFFKRKKRVYNKGIQIRKILWNKEPNIKITG